MKQFIIEMVNLFDEVSTSDLQGMVEAFCLQTGENEDEVLDAIYKEVDKSNRRNELD